jgi:hypothetical protein
MIANFAFMPKHLLGETEEADKALRTDYAPVCTDNNGASGLDEE